MAQILDSVKPLKVVTDRSAKYLKNDEAAYLKNYHLAFNAKAKEGKEGGNAFVGTPNRSNKKASTLLMPAGINKTVLSLEIPELNWLVYGNWNSNGMHGLYMINGDTLDSKIILIDKELNFSIEEQYYVAEHRCTTQLFYYDEGGDLSEVQLIYTDGNNWQRCINLLACLATSGFDAIKFPYFKLRKPQYDRREFLELAVRPPMFAPVITAVPATAADLGQLNYLLNQSIQLAYVTQYTDGRKSVFSPYSLPYIQKSSPCNVNNAGLPRCIDVELNVGSAFVERIIIYARQCNGDWHLYDTIEKFGAGTARGQYWLRENEWSKYSFNPDTNTIKYRYCGEKQAGIISQEDANIFETALPIKSITATKGEDSLFLFDNLRGYNNIPQSELDKIKLSVVDGDTSSANLVSRKITLWAYMAKDGKFCQFIYNVGTDKTNRYGATSFIPPGSGHGSSFSFDTTENDYLQLTTQKNAGFVCYLAGTPYYAISTMWLVNPDGSRVAQPIIDLGDTAQKDFVQGFFEGGGYIAHKFEFTVPAGRYIARMAATDANVEESYERTSAPVIGLADRKYINNQDGLPGWDNVNTVSKEMEIDVCSSDYDSWDSPNTFFYVFVPYSDNSYRYITGYVREDDVTSPGMEQINYLNTKGSQNYARGGTSTDHNGFYFQFAAKGDADKSEVYFRGSLNCQGPKDLFQTTVGGGGSGYYRENISTKVKNGGFGPCNQIKIKGIIKDCKTGNGYSGIAVTVTSGGTTYTGSDGSYELVVHDGYAFQRKGKIYVNSSGISGGCYLVPCDGSCLQPVSVDLSGVSCSNCTERVYPGSLDFSFQILNQDERTLKDGRYPVGVAGFDLAGRSQFVGNAGYVTVPTFLEKGNLNPSKIKVDITAPLNLDPAIKYLIFYVGKLQRQLKYIQWVGDNIQFLDKNGTEVPSGNGAIRAKISLQSLLDYNKQYNFSTTVEYQFTPGDFLRIYDDGDGNLFKPVAPDGFMDFQILGTDFNQSVSGEVTTTVKISETETQSTTDRELGNSIVIGYDKRLQALKDKCGFWLEISTPDTLPAVESMFEVAGTIFISADTVAAQSIVLNTWNAYFQNRSFHLLKCSGKAILHPFLSSAISDFWGKDCTSNGRVSIKNPQALQAWEIDEVIKSDPISNENIINGLATFKSSNKKSYGVQNRGGIVGVIGLLKLFLVICENDWFLADYNMNFIRVDRNGNVVSNVDNALGDPQQKDGSVFGCNINDIGQIVYSAKDGVVFWIDDKNEAIIMHNFRQAVDISSIDNKSYFSNKFNLIRKYNASLPEADRLNNLIEKSSGYDEKYKRYNISFRPRHGLKDDPQYFTNTERGIVLSAAETFSFDIQDMVWRQFRTFVPEFYGKLLKSISGNEMVTFVNGIPYFHNSKDVTTYNEYYGVSDTQVLDVVFADKKGIEKIAQAIRIDSRMRYFADRITSDNPNMLSYIPAAWFKARKNGYQATVLRNMATYPSNEHPVKSMLIDGGGVVSGSFFRIRLVRSLTEASDYNEIDEIKLLYIGLEKSR